MTPKSKAGIHWFALVAVASTSAFLVWLSQWLVRTLAARDWCYTAIGADRVTPNTGATDALTACVSLLTFQVKALALDSYIAIGTMALCLAVLVVVVLANARLELDASATGVHTKITGDAVDAAQETADAAQDKADEIKGDKA